MRQTIVEKILSEHSGNRARAGDIVIAGVDYCFGQDWTSGMIIDSFNNTGSQKVVASDKFCMVLDHSAPSPNIGISQTHAKMRKFAREHGIKVFDVGSGVCHQIIGEEGVAVCGDLVVGADSHTCTLGALNIFAPGVGATDLSVVLASGKLWFKVPETKKIVLNGTLSKGTYAKDVILHVISDMGSSGAVYEVLEFSGEIVDKISIDSRFTIANMAVESGAKCGIMAADKKTLAWLKKKSDKEPIPVESDENARYVEIREYDLTDLAPQVSVPDQVDNVRDIDEVEGTRIDSVYIGTCANGRVEDLEIAACILKGNKVASGVKLIITPASKSIYLEALKKGFIQEFINSGAIVNNPGCGACVGTHQGVLADGEVVLSTANRNYKGRMGNVNASIYLGSPATAAASAIAGEITDPRVYKRRL